MKLLTYISNAIAIQDKELHEKRTTQFITSLTGQDKDLPRDKETHISVQEETGDTVDEGLVKQFQEGYTQIKRFLNISLSKFQAEELREKTETYAEYEKFTKLRKELTTLYKNGQNITQQLNTLRTTGTLNIITCQTSILPLGLPRAIRHELQDNIENTVHKQNITILHLLIKQHLTKQEEVEDFMKELSEFVIAKAYRTVTLTHKNLSDGALRHKEQQEKRQESSNKEARFATVTRYESSQEYDKYEEPREYRDKGRYTYRRYQEPQDYYRQRDYRDREYRHKDRNTDTDESHHKRTHHISRSGYHSGSDDDSEFYHHRTRRDHPRDSHFYDRDVHEGFREPKDYCRHRRDDTRRDTRTPREEFRDTSYSHRYKRKYPRQTDSGVTDSEDESSGKYIPRKRQFYHRQRSSMPTHDTLN